MSTQEEILIEHYKINVDLYKTYLKLLIKFNIFYYAITGAILSYYFGNFEKIPVLKYSLIFPIVMSLGFFIFYLWAQRLVNVSRNDIALICQTLKLKAFPEFKVLKILLIIFGLLSLLVAIILSIVFCLQFANN